jgi:hypothetical protein
LSTIHKSLTRREGGLSRKYKAIIKSSQDQMNANIKTGLEEEIRATPEKHYKQAPYKKAMHLLTDLQAGLQMFYMEFLKEGCTWRQMGHLGTNLRGPAPDCSIPGSAENMAQDGG